MKNLISIFFIFEGNPKLFYLMFPVWQPASFLMLIQFAENCFYLFAQQPGKHYFISGEQVCQRLQIVFPLFLLM